MEISQQAVSNESSNSMKTYRAMNSEEFQQILNGKQWLREQKSSFSNSQNIAALRCLDVERNGDQRTASFIAPLL